MSIQKRFFVLLLLLVCSPFSSLKAQFIIEYAGSTVFYLDNNCSAQFDLDGIFPLVTSNIPGAIITVDSFDSDQTGYELNSTIIGEEIIDVHFWYEDDQGNDSLYIFEISFQDTLAPQLAIEFDTIHLLCKEDLPDISSYLVDDNCDIVGGVSLNNYPLQVLPESNCGPDTIEVINLIVAVDEYGNKDSLFQTVFMGIDTIAPTAIVPNDTVISCIDDLQAILSIGLLDSYDNCNLNTVSIDTSSQIINGNCTDGLKYKRYWTLTDACGNISIDSQVITLIDDLPPIFITPSDTVVDCNADNSISALGSPTGLFDECSGIFQVDYQDVFDTLDCPGSINLVRIWEVSDSCVNIALDTQLIQIVDTIAPSFAGPVLDSIYLQCDQIDSLDSIEGPFNVTDACSAVTIDTVDVSLNQVCANTYEIERTFIFEDACENIDSVKQWIFLTDTIAPVISSEGEDLIMSCSSTLNIDSVFQVWINNHAGLTLLDACSETQDLSWSVFNAGTLTPATLDDLSCNLAAGVLLDQAIDFVFEDECGNQGSITKSVKVLDNSAPVISFCGENIAIDSELGLCGATVEVPVPFAMDDCRSLDTLIQLTQTEELLSTGIPESIIFGLDISVIVPNANITPVEDVVIDLVLENVDANEAEEYMLVYGENGSLLGSTSFSNIECGISQSQFTIPLAQYLQWAQDGQLQLSLEPNIPLDITDAINPVCTNSSTATVSISYNAVFSEGLSYSYALDNSNYNLIDSTGIVSMFLDVGIHEISFSVEDCGANVSTCNRTIEIKDIEAPVLTCSSNKEVFLTADSCSLSVELDLPLSIEDNCSPGTINEIQIGQQFIPFTFNSSLGEFLADTIVLNFEGISANQTGSVSLKLDLQGDVDNEGEFFTVVTQDNTIIGTTEIGEPNVLPGSCMESSVIDLVIDENTFLSNLSSGGLMIFLISNNPAQGVGSNGINPCDSLSEVNGDQIDLNSEISATLTYNTWNLSYFIAGQAGSGNTTVQDINGVYSEVFNLGIDTVYFVASDANGNLDTCHYQLELIDNISPEMSCIDSSLITFNSLDTDSLLLDVNQFDMGSFDNCSLDSISIMPKYIDCTNADDGIVTVTLIGIDGSGNESSCTSQLTIEDTPLSPIFGAFCDGNILDASDGLCLGDSLIFDSDVSVSDINSLNFSWINPNGDNIATGPNPIIPLLEGVDYSGDYTLIVSGPNACPKSAQFSISSSMLESPEIQSSEADTICEGTAVDLTVVNNLNITDATYNWYEGEQVGSGALISSTNLNALNLGEDLEAGNHCFYVEVSKDCCSAVSVSSYCFEVIAKPTALLKEDSITICRFEDLSLSAIQSNNPNWVYEWSGPGIPVPTFGQTQVIVDYNPNHSGVFPVNLQVYDENLNSCAIESLEVTVEVLEKPSTPTLDIDHSKVCVGATINLIGTSEDDFAGVTAFEFIGNGLLVSNTPVFELIDVELTDGGSYQLVTAGNVCKSDTSNTVDLVVNPRPIAEIKSEIEICASENIYILSATEQPDVVSYQWTLPDPADPTLFGNNLIINNPDEGTYILDVSKEIPGCENQDTLELVIHDNPEIIHIEDNLGDCYMGDDFELVLSYESNLSLDQLEQNWYPSTLINIVTDSVYINSNPDDLSYVTLEIIDPIVNCTTSASIDIDIPLPLPVLDPPKTQADVYLFCENEPVIFQTTNHPDAQIYIWNFGDGAHIDTTEISELSINDISQYDYGKVNVHFETGNGCISDFSNSTVYEIVFLPELEVQFDTTVCENETIDFSLIGCLSNGVTANWETPQGLGSATNTCNFSHVQSDSGIYTYFYKYGKDGCYTELRSVDVFVKPLPNVVELDTPSDSVCVDLTKPIDLTINQPQAGVDYALWVNNELYHDFDSLPGPVGWDVSVGNSIPQMSEVTYEYTLLGALNGCFSEDTFSLDITLFSEPDTKAFIFEDTFAFCESEPIFMLKANPIPFGIDGGWNPINSTDPVLITPNDSSTIVDNINTKFYYEFEWSLTYGACKDFSTDTAYLYVAEEQQAYAGLDVDTCKIESISVNATPSINIGPESAFWGQPSDQLGATIFLPYQPLGFIDLDPNNEIYEFYWTLPDYGCGISSDTIKVKLLNEFATVEVSFFEDCGDGTAQLYGVESANYEGTWSSPDPDIVIDDVNLHNTFVRNLKEGPNIFYYDFLGGVCGEDYGAELVIDYTFSPQAIDDIVSLEFAGTNILIDVLLNDFNSDLDLDEVVIVSQPNQGTVNLDENTIQYISDQNFVGLDSFKYEMISEACDYSSSIATVFINIGENDDCTRIPNIITPGLDGTNDVFVIPCIPKYPENSVEIFNIWGDKVFEQSPYANDWNGDDLPTGTYYYVIQFTPGGKEEIGFLHIQR